MSELIIVEKLGRFSLCWQQPVVKAIHMVVDQEGRSIRNQGMLGPSKACSY